MPTLALFGATGRTGRHALSAALEAGWTVRALARNATALPARDGVTVIEGDARDSTTVAAVVAGSDAVISVLGQVKGSPPTLQADATSAIASAMRGAGVRRIVSLSGGGLPWPDDQPKLADRVIRRLLRLLSPAVLDDAIAHAAVLRESGLDWTIVRGPRLTDAPRTGGYRVGWVGVNASTSIGRADLANAILAQVDDDTYVRSMPFVSH